MRAFGLYNSVKDLYEWKGLEALEILGGIANPVGYAVGKYQEVMLDGIKQIRGAAWNDRKFWNAFIKVQNYKAGDERDEHGIRIPVESGKPYWVEVRGFRGARATGFGRGYGYATMLDADRAALNGAKYWICKQLGHGPQKEWGVAFDAFDTDPMEMEFYQPKRNPWYYSGPTVLGLFMGMSGTGGGR